MAVKLLVSCVPFDEVISLDWQPGFTADVETSRNDRAGGLKRVTGACLVSDVHCSLLLTTWLINRNYCNGL